ncbi:MAG TPA: DUF3179 domain-containing (seleno)protein [Thermoanaerobaculia bacterium]|nr:DUF3179 domain-containing (seleno)protein [Thermoanaerobaculia bacterium]
MRLLPGLPAIGAAIVLSTACFARQYRHNPRIAIVDGDPIVQMKPEGELPSVDSARLVPADRHSDLPDEVDRVIGVVFGSEARAYPVGLLDKFEVVNDTAGTLPFVVVRCALTGIAAVYDRRAAGRRLTFENSGALWRDTLVLRDRETGTYWTAATGRALAGPLRGEALTGIPAAVTRSDSWQKSHPETLYLDLDRSTAVSLPMRLYDASPAQGVSGTRTADRRYRPKQEVSVVGGESEAIAFEAEELRGAERIERSVDGHSILIEWDAALRIPRAYQQGTDRREIPVVPMYWFAVDRHFQRVWTWPELARLAGAGARIGN